MDEWVDTFFEVVVLESIVKGACWNIADVVPTVGAATVLNVKWVAITSATASTAVLS